MLKDREQQLIEAHKAGREAARKPGPSAVLLAQFSALDTERQDVFIAGFRGELKRMLRKPPSQNRGEGSYGFGNVR